MTDNTTLFDLGITAIGDLIEIDDEIYVVTHLDPLQMVAIEHFESKDLDT